MRHKLVTVGLLAALLLAMLAPSCLSRASAAGPAAPAATAAQTRAAILDKTRFLFHAGAAFFIIHHEYQRYKQGYFSAGTPGRVKHLVVAAGLLLIAVHEAKVAYGIAQKSHSKTLHVLATPIAGLAATIDAIRGKFAKGQGSGAELAQLNSAAGGINSLASTDGLGPIKDVATPLPTGS
jgi:hypothetical protein